MLCQNKFKVVLVEVRLRQKKIILHVVSLYK